MAMDESADAAQPPAIDPAAFLAAAAEAANVADYLDEHRLNEIAETVIREHEIDLASMGDWRKRMQRGIDLASLVKEDKTYPFENPANVRYPLITTAALQFNARAYQAIVPSDDVVKVKVLGRDPQGQKAARAMRVGAHMSWQLTSQIEEWEPSTDELLTVLSIVGTLVRKVWYDPVEGRARVRLIRPGCFVVNAAVTSLPDAPRIGEVLTLFPTEIAERRRAGLFRDVEYAEPEGEDRDAAQEFVEQHRRLDLDEDGYGEPYIVTVHKKNRRVARIVADFEPGDVRMGEGGVIAINRGSYFVDYHFLPSVDGGFFGTGLGFLLGDISDTINSIINMMLDAGHMASRGGGFIGSEFRIKGGSQQFRPGEWKATGARGAEIKSAIVPLTFPGPDATLFNLLGLLIEAGKEVASVKDVLTGDVGGRALTATTTLALIEQGMQQFTAAYKRIFRSLKREFRLLARINARYLDPVAYSQFCDEADPAGNLMMVNPQMDYDLNGMDIEPVADPRSVSRMQEAAKAEIVMQMAERGLVDRAEASKRALQAASVPDVEALAPKPDPMQMQMAQMQMQAMQADLAIKMVGIEQALADLEKTRAETIKTVGEAAKSAALVRLDQARLALEAVRDGLGSTLGRGAGGVAGASGQPGSTGMPVGPVAAPAGGGPIGLVGGPGMAGGGSPVAPAA